MTYRVSNEQLAKEYLHSDPEVKVGYFVAACFLAYKAGNVEKGDQYLKLCSKSHVDDSVISVLQATRPNPHKRLREGPSKQTEADTRAVRQRRISGESQFFERRVKEDDPSGFQPGGGPNNSQSSSE